MANAKPKRHKLQDLTGFPSRRGYVQDDDRVTRQFQEALDAPWKAVPTRQAKLRKR